jgi:hypothetical protein
LASTKVLELAAGAAAKMARRLVTSWVRIDEGAEDGITYSAPLGVKVDIDEGPEDGFYDHRRYDRR